MYVAMGLEPCHLEWMGVCFDLFIKPGNNCESQNVRSLSMRIVEADNVSNDTMDTYKITMG